VSQALEKAKAITKLWISAFTLAKLWIRQFALAKPGAGSMLCGQNLWLKVMKLTFSVAYTMVS
jgi:hypothetical protein